MEYNFIEIERKWQQWWAEHKTYKAETDPAKPKYYVLDMFPYPSGGVPPEERVGQQRLRDQRI